MFVSLLVYSEKLNSCVLFWLQVTTESISLHASDLVVIILYGPYKIMCPSSLVIILFPRMNKYTVCI